MTDLALDDYAARAILEEPEWLAAWQSAGSPPFPQWATPHPQADDSANAGEVNPSSDLVKSLQVRDGAVLAVEVATSAHQIAILAEVSTDLSATVSVVRRLVVDRNAGPQATQLVPGVEVSVSAIGHLVDEILRMLPVATQPNTLVEAELPAELTVAFSDALSTGDQGVIDAVCADQGWSNPPEVLVALVSELVGNAMITIQRPNAPLILGQWLLTNRGWVELVYTPQATVRHVPRSEDDIARTLVTALTGPLSDLYARAAASNSAKEA